MAADSVTLQKQTPKQKDKVFNMHEPVLLNEVVEMLNPIHGESYLDLTAGYGGHSSKILGLTKNYKNSVLVDRDQMAIDYLSKSFHGTGISIIKDNFYNATSHLNTEDKRFDIILADLGVSSQHLDLASRGFSFMAEGPLDMRMDQTQIKTAADIVNTESVEELTRIFKEYGEEKQAKRIAFTIVNNRPYSTTQELARTLESVVGWKKKGHHPATRVFQALRIAVNDELDLLNSMLQNALQLLTPGGRFGVITFHSLEDRIVKQYFAEATLGEYDQKYKLLSKKPIAPTQDEIVHNPRSRSAKLRGVAKIKKERTV